MEKRTFNLDVLVVERRDKSDPMIAGHAAVFDTLSEEMWGFREKIAPGAFSDAIKSDDVRALFNHEPNLILGRNTAGTLRMSEDDKGLSVEIDPPDTQYARDLMTSMDRGDITQMSFGFRVKDEEWDGLDGDNPIRTIKRVSLFDVSPVTYPAYPETDVALRELRARHKAEADQARAARAASAIESLRRRLTLAEF